MPAELAAPRRIQWLLILLTGLASYPAVGFLMAFVIMHPDNRLEPGNPVLLNVIILVTTVPTFGVQTDATY